MLTYEIELGYGHVIWYPDEGIFLSDMDQYTMLGNGIGSADNAEWVATLSVMVF